MSQPPYPFGQQHDYGQQPPVDPYQPAGYQPSYADPTYSVPDPQQPAGYPPPTGYPPAARPYPNQPYSPQPYQDVTGYAGQQPGHPGGYQGYPGGYAPPQPPPRNRTATVLVVVVAVLLVVVVGGGILAAKLLSSPGQPAAAGSATPSVGASAPDTSGPTGTSGSTGQVHGGDLRTYLVTMPSSAKRCAKEEGTDEKLSLDQAAQLSSDTAGRKAQLQQDNFTGGAVRCWVASDHTTVDVRLYQFGSTDDAKTFFDDDIDATSNGYAANDITDVSGVPEGKSFGDPATDKDSQGFVHVVSIGLNGDVVLVVALAQPPPLKVSVSDGLLKQEYDKL